jgi:hypothetical protein
VTVSEDPHVDVMRLGVGYEEHPVYQLRHRFDRVQACNGEGFGIGHLGRQSIRLVQAFGCSPVTVYHRDLPVLSNSNGAS